MGMSCGDKEDISMSVMSESKFDVDPNTNLTPIFRLPSKGIDLRRKGNQTSTGIDPIKAMDFDDPLLSKQWHLVIGQISFVIK